MFKFFLNRVSHRRDLPPVPDRQGIPAQVQPQRGRERGAALQVKQFQTIQNFVLAIFFHFQGRPVVGPLRSRLGGRWRVLHELGAGGARETRVNSRFDTKINIYLLKIFFLTAYFVWR